jgi:hypothetical protein
MAFSWNRIVSPFSILWPERSEIGALAAAVS